MNGRDLVLGSIRRSLGVSGTEAPRKTATDERIARHPRGLIPERGTEPARKRIKQFREMLAEANGTVEEVDLARSSASGGVSLSPLEEPAHAHTPRQRSAPGSDSMG